MARQHDADLCDRIRALEKRVQELEAQQANHHCHGIHWHYPDTYYPWTPNVYPSITITGTSTTDWQTFTNIISSFDSSANLA